MKKVLLLLSLLTFVFTSCDKDDENSGVNPLIGKWKIFSVDTNDYESLDDCMSKSWILFEETSLTSKEYVKKGLDCKSSQNTVNYTVEGNNTLRFKDKGIERVLVYSVSGNKLTLEGSAGTVVYVKM